jgi:hypothetical protein
MPTEYRFDDLDLREEPCRGEGQTDPVNTQDSLGAGCTRSLYCTDGCCSIYCGG